MKKSMFLALAATMFSGIYASSVEARSFKFFVRGEYFTQSGAHEDIENGYRDDQREALEVPGMEASLSSTINAAAGGRIGVLFPKESGLFLGGNLGYIRAPKGQFILNMRNNGIGFRQEINASLVPEYVRLMVEGGKDVRFGEKFALRLRAGLGMAKASQQVNYYDFDYSNTTPFRFKETSDKTGVTYEIGPSLVWTLGGVNLDFGVTYVGLPKIPENADKGTPEFKWNPIGIHLGIEF